MSVIFATHLVALLYGMYAGAIMYDLGPKVFNIGNIILDLPLIICAFIIASKKSFQRKVYSLRTAQNVPHGYISAFKLLAYSIYCAILYLITLVSLKIC